MASSVQKMIAALALLAMFLAALPLYLHLQEMARPARPLGLGGVVMARNLKQFLGKRFLGAAAPGLQRRGALSPMAMGNPVIPKVIHYSYKYDLTNVSRPFPSVTFAVSWRAWRRHFPESEYRYQFWSDEDNRRCVEEYFPEYLEDFRDFKDTVLSIPRIRYLVPRIIFSSLAILRIEGCLSSTL